MFQLNSMITLSIILATFTSAAHADFEAARERAHFRSHMQASHASGVYAGIKSAQAELNFADSGDKATSISLSFPNTRRTETLQIVDEESNRCYKLYKARSIDRTSIQTNVELRNYSGVCRSRITANWHMEVIQTLNNEMVGGIVLSGNREALDLNL